eukprot:1125323-Lingulodinium_polyedra.AAC.1
MPLRTTSGSPSIQRPKTLPPTKHRPPSPPQSCYVDLFPGAWTPLAFSFNLWQGHQQGSTLAPLAELGTSQSRANEWMLTLCMGTTCLAQTDASSSPGPQA